MKIEFSINKADELSVYEHLLKCETDFIPPLSSRVNIKDYSQKIKNHAVTFEAWDNTLLVGFIAAYLNDEVSKKAFITNVSVIKEYKGQGIAGELLQKMIKYAFEKGLEEINLEVDSNNLPALELYKKFNFKFVEDKGNAVLLRYGLIKT